MYGLQQSIKHDTGVFKKKWDTETKSTHFATKTDGVPNLGSSVVATVTVLLWGAGAQRRVASNTDLGLAKLRIPPSKQSSLPRMMSVPKLAGPLPP
jgi:hypothetical protein